MAKKIRVWDGSAWQDVAPALPYTAIHSAQASMPATGVDGQVWLDTDGTLSDTAFVPLSTIDAKGDLLVGTADNTVSRLASSGTNDQVLTVDTSTATGLKWATPAAGGMTLLASGSIAASATGIDITSISGSYNELWLYVTNYSTTTAADLRIRTNNNSSGDYSANYIEFGIANYYQAESGFLIAKGVGATDSGQSIFVRFVDYANTTGWKLIEWVSSKTDNKLNNGSGLTRSTSAINRVSLVTAAGTFDSGTYKLYGVK